MKTKAILTGATGMVGEGVLLECLANPIVERILVIGRHPCGIAHAKLEEVLHNDFTDLSPIAEKFKGYDACFFCAGVTSVGKNENEYSRLPLRIRQLILLKHSSNKTRTQNLRFVMFQDMEQTVSSRGNQCGQGLKEKRKTRC